MKIFLLIFFIATSNGLSITCDFNFNNFLTLGSVYTCDVISVDLTDGQINVVNVEGTHLPSQTSNDVKGVLFSGFNCPNFNLNAVPKDFQIFFPNFVALSFESCAINSLKGDELADYKNLKHFAIGNSNLETVPGDFFASTPDLTLVYFSYNKIKKIGSGLLNNLKKLQQVHFGSNVCINKYAAYSGAVRGLIRALDETCSSTNDCGIDDVEEFSCELDSKIQQLWIEINNLSGDKNLNQENLLLLEGQTQEVQIDHENLEINLKDAWAKNNYLKNLITELEAENIELENLLKSQDEELTALDGTMSDFVTNVLSLLIN